MRKGSSSRRKTPWSDKEEGKMTPTQRFLSDRYEAQYQEWHPALKDTGEAKLINSVVPTDCPYCAESSFSRFCQTRNGVQRYRCKACGRTFTPITGTIIVNRKICRNI